MEKNIFELLEEWNLARVEGYKERAHEIEKKIELLLKEYRER